MGEATKIEWAQNSDGSRGYTFNPWWGCNRVSPACDHCYAADWARRFDVGWGASAAPRVYGDKHWREPLKWNTAAAKAGIRARVFCASMADVFEFRGNEHGAVLDDERAKLWALIEETPHLDWLLLTKRPENVLEMIPERWRAGLPSNVWVGATVENQEQADRRIPHLLRVPARVRFLSCEPLLGPIALPSQFVCCGEWQWTHPANPPECCGEPNREIPGLHWVIAGGESGPGARPSHPDWLRGLREQCEEAGVPFFFKQWGDWRPKTIQVSFACPASGHSGYPLPYQSLAEKEVSPGVYMERPGKKAAGRLLDGRTHDGLPS